MPQGTPPSEVGPGLLWSISPLEDEMEIAFFICRWIICIHNDRDTHTHTHIYIQMKTGTSTFIWPVGFFYIPFFFVGVGAGGKEGTTGTALREQ